MELAIAISLALAFVVTNGFHDAANAIATLVATRGARPGQALGGWRIVCGPSVGGYSASRGRS